MEPPLILFIVAAVLFGVAAVFDARPRFHFGWAGAVFLTVGLAMQLAGLE